MCHDVCNFQGEELSEGALASASGATRTPQLDASASSMAGAATKSAAPAQGAAKAGTSKGSVECGWVRMHYGCVSVVCVCVSCVADGRGEER